jgi:hypothetical protein
MKTILWGFGGKFMNRQLLLSCSLILLASLLVSCGARLESQEGSVPQGSITVEGVQVTAGEQIAVQGQSTLPDGTCLGSELRADGELQTWWPGDTCVAVEGGAWQMVVSLGASGIPAQLDPSAEYVLRVFQQNSTDVVTVFAFDLAGPPIPNP